MRKVFPAIVILIALSLLGLIILEVSWFSNMVQVQEQKITFKVEEASMDVTLELSKHTPDLIFGRHPRNIPTTPNGFAFNVSRIPFISQRYSETEINNKLEKVFDKEGLDDLQFEFAIIYSGQQGLIEMASKNFQEVAVDTVHNKPMIFPLIPPGSNEIGLIANESLIIIIPDFRKQIWQSLIWMIVGAVFFTLIVITAFYLTIKTIFNQRKLNKIKSDFINNMTHEFKTPLATISLAIDALRNEKVQHDAAKQNYFSGVIKEENIKMNKHVETILQAAVMDKQEIKLNFIPLHVHEILQLATDHFALQLEDKKASVILKFDAKNDLVNADEIHFTNLINNLVDNALKYSKDNLVIKITTHSTDKNIFIQVEDNGIGMSKETVKRIFEKFYRAHTGNLHNVKGFGLGMSYVKTVIDEHKAKIKVESTFGKGSIFTIEMSLAKPENVF